MKKISIGLVTGAAMLLINMITGIIFQNLFPSIKNEYGNASLFRPWSDPLMMLMLLHPFIVGVILAWIWGIIHLSIPGVSPNRKGINFSIGYFLLSFSGMFISYCTFPVSFILIVSWSAGIFLQSLCAGFVFSRFLK